MKPVATDIGNFWSMDWLNPTSVAIALVCGGRESHCGVYFTMTDQTIQYYEMLWRNTKERITIDGATGPKPFERLLNWEKKSRFRTLHCRLLNLPKDVAESKRQFCLTLVRTHIPYARTQIFSNFLLQMFGIQMPTDPSEMHCSEMLAFVDLEEVDTRDAKHRNCDAVTPPSSKRAVEAYIHKRNTKGNTT